MKLTVPPLQAKLLVPVLLVVVTLAAFTVTAEASGPTTASPIKHLIIIMQENHSFDNYFGMYPGVNGFPKGLCVPINPDNSSQGCVKPFQINASTYVDLSHGFPSAYTDWNEGFMNGFLVGQNGSGNANGTMTMSYYTNATIPNYWTFASDYVLADNFYSSVFGYSLPNHWLAIAGATPPCDIATDCTKLRPTLYLQEAQGIPTIADLLVNSSIPWKYYDYVLGTNYTEAIQDKSAFNYKNPLASQNRSYSSAYSPHFVQNTQIFTDIANGNLPAVSYVLPNDNVSEHPPANVTLGMEWTTSIIDAVMQSKYWSSSAIILSWDDYGGFYDNVSPPRLAHPDECLRLQGSELLNPDCYLGFRVPALIISPFAKHGYVDNTQYSFESILKFIEWNWRIPNRLGPRVQYANNLLSAFDFNQTPNPAVVIPMSQATIDYVKQVAVATGPDTD